jgi:hypothetical protein
MTRAALVTTPAVLFEAVGDCVVVAHSAVHGLPDAAEDERVVVHREAEKITNRNFADGLALPRLTVALPRR